MEHEHEPAERPSTDEEQAIPGTELPAAPRGEPRHPGTSGILAPLALAMGVGALVSGVVPFLGYAMAIPLGAMAITLGVLARGREPEQGGHAVAGIVTGGLGVLATTAWALALIVPGLFGGFGGGESVQVETFRGPGPRDSMLESPRPGPGADGEAKDALQRTKAEALSVAEGGSFDDVTLRALAEADPPRNFLPGDETSTSPSTISVEIVDPDEIRLAARGGRWCFALRHVVDGDAEETTLAHRTVAVPDHDCSAGSFSEGDFGPDGWPPHVAPVGPPTAEIEP